MSEQSNRLVWMSVVGVLLLGLLIVGGFAVHRLGWSQGFTAAEAAGERADVPVPTLAPPGWRALGSGQPVALLVPVLLGFLFTAVIAKLLRLFVWGLMGAPMMHRFAGGPWPQPGSVWRRHRYARHGSWGWSSWREPFEEQEAMDPEP